MQLFTGVIDEMKRHPYTSLAALLCLVICIPGGSFLLVQKADASDLQALQQQLAGVAHTLKRESAATELSNVRRELFDIDLRITTLERTGGAVEDMLYRRRDDLRAQQRQLELRLRDLDRAGDRLDATTEDRGDQ